MNAAPEPDSLRIDDLARVTGVPVRNIREYQSRGLLLAPQREGRRAHYGEDHVVRLRLITRMLARGYTLASIRDLLEVWAGGRELEELLGLEAAVSRGWGDGERVDLTREQLDAIFGKRLSDADLELLIETEAVVPVGDAYNCSREKMVETVPPLMAAGIPIGPALQTLVTIRGHMDAIADEMVKIAMGVLVPSDVSAPDDIDLHALTASIDSLRGVGEILANGIFGLALNRAVDEAVRLVAGRSLDARLSPAVTGVRSDRDERA